jgi:hypothetical protein
VLVLVLVVYNSMSKEVLLTPVIVARNEQEKCLIEGSINSLRISICIKQSDEMEVCDACAPFIALLYPIHLTDMMLMLMI